MHKITKNAISFLKENKKTVLTLLVVFIFVDILFVTKNSDIVLFSVLLSYIIFIKIFKINSKLTFLLCLGLLITMYLDYFFTLASVSTEKGAVWLTLFLIVGVIQQWRE